ncbi:hypothetical protein PRUPE_I005600 [Prunus persica]|uniref:Uncharacterized protein n=1 Tax=Prunus persica TaxID=3760 RepID=M5VPE5_PRUPE|nr:hypothetical protein PRUPE_I005600 [Prunus persica]
MKRKKTRLMKEYLYRKSLEGKERLLYENKRKIREALQEGKTIPTELQNEEAELRREIDLEDENTAEMRLNRLDRYGSCRRHSVKNCIPNPRTHIDDEYAKAAERDPKILITTSRNPSAPLVQFAKELKLVFPNAQQMNRGGQVAPSLFSKLKPPVTVADRTGAKRTGSAPPSRPGLFPTSAVTPAAEKREF